MSAHQLAVLFFLQLTVILAAVRLVGRLARRLGQPQVVGEMIAGVLLGPSLLGALSPAAQAWLFPEESRPLLYAVSQLGLVLYMFLIGVELRVDLVRQRMKSAVAVSVAGIAAPFAAGALLAGWMVEDDRFFTPGVARWEAMLFVGAALGVTAFPMLARIIHEQGISGTALGTLGLAAGSIDDAAAWILLALVLAGFAGDPTIAALALGGGALYVLAVWGGVRPLLARLAVRAERAGSLSAGGLGAILVLLMAAAWVTDTIGIYAVFGAFVLGAAVPRGVVARDLQRQLEPLTSSLLLPLFFVYSGLHTRLLLVATPTLAPVALLVIVVACLAKGVACWAAARASGESPRDAAGLGALMNARGLMELILLGIGLEHGLITPTLFTVLVLMAVVTTLLASPLFAWTYRRREPAAA